MTFFKLLYTDKSPLSILKSVLAPHKSVLLSPSKNVTPDANSRKQRLIPSEKGILTFALLLSAWFLINLLQSIFTQIGNDEAYYWLFSKHPDWGYFDHPPMTAMLIKAGTLFLNNEVAVRLPVIILQLCSLVLIWKTTGEKLNSKKNIILFFILAAAIPLFQIYGFIATPDAPLLFFTALFFLSYKSFLSKQNSLQIIFLALSMAGMMYSKYHGILIIVFTILSNFKLIVNRYFLAASALSLILYFPHLYWQIENNFPTLQYQLANRIKSFRLTHFLEFWPYQLLAFNPLIIILFLKFFLKRNFPLRLFDRSLLFVTMGIFSFFWISSWWIRPEPHWTAAASVPALILLFQYIRSDASSVRFVFRFVLPSLLLLFVARLCVIFPILPFKLEFHGQKEWAQQINTEAGTLPVGFVNSYQKASVYTFYTGNKSFSLNNIYYRRNQFDLWAWEQLYQNKPVTIVSSPHPRMITDLVDTIIEHDLILHDTLLSFQRIEIITNEDASPVLKKGTSVNLPVTLINHGNVDVTLDIQGVSFTALFFKNEVWHPVPAVLHADSPFLKSKQSLKASISFIVPDLTYSTCSLGFGIRTAALLEGFNSKMQNIQME